MDCGDAGHILLSKRVAEDLGQYTQWQPHLHGLGECEVKHGAKVELYNLYTSAIGNAKVPEKVRRDQRRRIQAARQRRKLAFIALLAVALIALTGVWLWQHATGSTVERSIAVLPFENLSAEKENGYFAGGIQDEILTNLAKIGDLKVISRSSVMIYATNRPNIRDIAKAIGVAAVVEGSVQRVANRVRINVQLVNAANDQHIWAEHYEKDVSDIFAAQRDVAFEIASSLHAQLSPAEKTRLERRPTSNGAATSSICRHKIYMRGLNHSQRSKRWRSYIRKRSSLIPLLLSPLRNSPTWKLSSTSIAGLPCHWRERRWRQMKPCACNLICRKATSL